MLDERGWPEGEAKRFGTLRYLRRKRPMIKLEYFQHETTDFDAPWPAEAEFISPEIMWFGVDGGFYTDWYLRHVSPDDMKTRTLESLIEALERLIAKTP